MTKTKEFRIIETSVMDRWKSEHTLRYIVQRFTGPPINDYYPIAAFSKESEAKAYKRQARKQACESVVPSREDGA